MNPLVTLMRRYWADYLSRQNVDALDNILVEDYVLRIGGGEFVGRDQFKAAAADIFKYFPDLEMIVHDIITDGSRMAVLFSERGNWRAGGSAMWDVITLFRSDGKLLRSCYAEQDFMGRRNQLRSGIPADRTLGGRSPWAAEVGSRDEVTERVARDWLLAQDLHAAPSGVLDGTDIADAHRWLLAEETVIDELFSVGQRAAFHLTQQGRYQGGFEDLTDADIGREASCHVSGVLDVQDGAVCRVYAVSDRLESEQRLKDAALSPVGG